MMGWDSDGVYWVPVISVPTLQGQSTHCNDLIFLHTLQCESTLCSGA